MPLNFTANQLLSAHRVAPFTGAWIETSGSAIHHLLIYVAPFTGAWIETQPVDPRFTNGKVAPFTGAWIETLSVPA